MMRYNKNQLFKQFSKYAIVITASLSIAFCVFLLRTVHKARKKQHPTKQLHFKKKVALSSSVVPEIVLKNSELYILGNDQVKNCLIKSQTCELFQSKNKSICKNLHCKFSTNKKHIATLIARSAYINHSKKRVFLPGTILGTFQDWHFTNQDVFYNSNTHTMTAANITMLNNKNFFLQAGNSTIDLKHEQIRFKNGVECHLHT